MDLPLDIKYKIASFNMDVWIKLSYIDEEFKQFSYKEGRKLFIDLFTVIENNNYGTSWKFFGELHREDDKPARIWLDGTQEWYQHGKRHRNNDQPAFIVPYCSKKWYQNNLLHRDNDRPAVIFFNGEEEWWLNGYKLQRWINNESK